jgi:hypothetical protein
MMAQIKCIQDPLGNTILIPSTLYLLEGGRSLSEIKQVVTTPAFVIQIVKETLYFIRSIDWEHTLMVEARLSQSYFIVKACTQNPTPESISSLLKRGGLISFQ